MHPDLVPFLPIKTYGFCMALALLAAWKTISALCRGSGRDPEPYSNLLTAMMFSGIVGARVAYVVEHWKAEFAANPWSVVRVDQGGLMFYGGLILACIVFAVWCRVGKVKAIAASDLFAASIPLAHAIGRVGCFFYGCCYGRLSDGPLGVAFPHGSPAWYEQLHAGQIASTAAQSLPVLPTQLFEAAANLALFAALFLFFRRFRRGTAALYLIGYALIRFAMEGLRGDPRAAIGPFSISQTISLALLAAGAILAYVSFARPPRSQNAAAS